MLVNNSKTIYVNYSNITLIIDTFIFEDFLSILSEVQPAKNERLNNFGMRSDTKTSCRQGPR
jgi:hypothetical protein